MGAPYFSVWVCDDFEGFWPVGTAAVVIAETPDEARELLKKAIKERGLNPEEHFTLRQLDPNTPEAYIIRDGNY